MPWYVYPAFFFAGAFFVNGIPHFVNGIQGKPFQTPFAKPPGKGLSTAKVNVIWGIVNFIVAYTLITRVAYFDFRLPCNMAIFGLGIFLTAVVLSWWFGKFNGGSTTQR
jgi:hypothetical protein